MRRRLALATILSASLACSAYGCSGDDNTGGGDTGDGGADATHDAKTDAKTDGTIPGVDAGHDTGAQDTGSPEDTGTQQDTSTPEDANDGATTDANDGATADANDGATNDAGTDANDAGTDASDGSTASDADAGIVDASDGAVADAGPPSVIVVRVGDGNAVTSGSATPVILEQHDVMTGALVGTPIVMPIAATGANYPFTLSNNSTSEGDIALSTDHKYVVLAGYAATPGTPGVSSSVSVSTDGGATTPRVVARIDAAGTVDTSTLVNAFSTSNVRSVASTDGMEFWLGGTGTSTTGGVEYTTYGSDGGGVVQVLATPNNVRRVSIVGAQLYGTSASGAADAGWYGVYTVGTGLPTTAGQAATLLPGFPNSTGPSPYSFIAFDLNAGVAGVDTIYLADDRTSGAGGIQKWTSDGNVWTLATTLVTNTGDASTTGTRGLTGYVDGANVVLVATTTDGRLVSMIDTGSGTPTINLLATAPANTAFRGVSLSPTP